MHKIFSFEEKTLSAGLGALPSHDNTVKSADYVLTYKNLSFGETLKILHAGCPLLSFMHN